MRFKNFALWAFCEIRFPGIYVMETSKEEGRLLAVVALLRGETATQVCQQYNICRSDLYKLRRRALAAMQVAMKDQRRGPHRPANRLPEETERSIKVVAQGSPTLSAYQVSESLAPESPCP